MKRIISMLLTITLIAGLFTVAIPNNTLTVNAAVTETNAVATYDFMGDSFVSNNMEYYVNTDPNSENYSYLVSRNGQNGMMVEHNHYLHMAVTNNAVTKSDSNLWVEITYFSEGNTSFMLQYNSSNGNAFQPVYVRKEDTNDWVTATVCLSDAAFDKQQYAKQCDFRIAGQGTEGIVIGKIRIINKAINPDAEPLLYRKTDTAASEFTGKTFTGYQGWFRTSDRYSGWQHYDHGAAEADGTKWPRPGHISIDYYPDVTEYDESSLEQTGFANLGNGETAKLFDSTKQDVIDTHFEWMNEYGIDGAAIQRFSTAITGKTFTNSAEQTQLYKIMKAAEQQDRLMYIMYDISGGIQDATDNTSISSYVNDIKFDWVYNIEQSLELLNSKAYATVNGKPVVCLWGFGVNERPDRVADYMELIDFFHERDCYVIIGVKREWRDQPQYTEVFKKADMLTPWYVGCDITSEAAIDSLYSNFLQPDLEWCKANGVDYYPVAYSGFSWALMHSGVPNYFPRNAGQNLWYQAYKLQQLGINSFYIAMFDEYDEGTAIAKNATDYFDIPQDQYFVTSSCDGYWLSSDYQLRVAGEAIKMVKGQREAVRQVPVEHSLGPIYYRNSFESKYAICNDPAFNGYYPVDPCFKNPKQVSADGATATVAIERNSTAKTGDYLASMTGRADKAGASYLYQFSECAITIKSGMKLSYSMYAVNELGRNTYVELICADGTRVSVSNAGMGAGSKRGTVGQWNDCSFVVGTGALVGKEIVGIVFGYNGEAGDYQAYFDNVLLEDSELEIEGSFNRPEANGYIDFSGTVSEEEGIHLVNISDEAQEGYTYKNDNGETYYLVIPTQKYAYFTVDTECVDSTDKDIQIGITYLDNTTGDITLDYNAIEGSEGVANSRYAQIKTQGTNSGQWKTVVFDISNANFRKEQNNGADFRVSGLQDGLYIKDVFIINSASDSENTVNYIANGDFTNVETEWPNLPIGFSYSYTGGDGYSPVKGENGEFVAYADNPYTFMMEQQVENLPNGIYSLSADMKLLVGAACNEILLTAGNVSKNVLSELNSDAYNTVTISEIQVSDGRLNIAISGNVSVNGVFIDNLVLNCTSETNDELFVPTLTDGSEFTFYDGAEASREKYISSGNIVINGGNGHKAISNMQTFTDFVYEAKVNITAGTAGQSSAQGGVIFRATNGTAGADAFNGYYFGLDVGNQTVQLGRMSTVAEEAAWTELAYEAATLSYNKEYRIEVTASGAYISCVVYDTENNKVAQLETMDSRWSQGGVGVRNWFTDVTFTDLKVLKYSGPTKVMLEFDANDGSEVEEQIIDYGTTPQRPADPTREGYKFAGWYTDEACTTVYDFGALTSHKVVYAKWDIDDIPVETVEITSQPQSVTANDGDTATFTVVATGNVLSYQWQAKAPSGSWKNLASSVQGYNQATLYMGAIEARNGYQYRCVVKGENGNVVTDAVTLTVVSGVTITSQPQDVYIGVNGMAVFTVEVTGNVKSYQWQSKTPTGSWKNASSAVAGYNEAIMSIPAIKARDGYQFRCVVKDQNGKNTITEVATLTINPDAALTITSQPKSVEVTAGTKASFSVAAKGEGLFYLWQYRTSSTAEWNYCAPTTEGYNTATIKVDALAANNGYQYRCVIANIDGAVLTTNAAKLTVK